MTDNYGKETVRAVQELARRVAELTAEARRAADALEALAGYADVADDVAGGGYDD